MHCNPKSPAAEAFRIIRTNLQFSNFNKQLKSILITSAGASEGKTTVISNLAITIAQSGIKILLIDADIRKPSVHKFFGVSNEKGLTNLLILEDKNHCDYIQKTQMDNLDLLLSGPVPPNPSELLGSNSMQKILEDVKSAYDMVLLDTSPVCIVTDPMILSSITDGVILLVNSGKTQIEAVQRAKELLLNVNANIIGVILNRIKRHDSNEYYYNYYYGEDREQKKDKNPKEKIKKLKEKIDKKDKKKKKDKKNRK